jgi:hypothetical protein
MTYKIPLQIFLFGLLAFCTCACRYKNSDYEALVDEVTTETAYQLMREDQLYIIGTGGGLMREIHRISMDFQCLQEMDLMQAREVLVSALEKYLSNINNSDKVRPYLHNYPFQIKDIEIAIFFMKPNRDDRPFNTIRVASASRGRLEYDAHGKKNPYSTYFIVCEETYEEAVEKLAQEKARRSLFK